MEAPSGDRLAEIVYDRAVSLALHPTDADAQVTKVADELLAAHEAWTTTIETHGGWDYESPDDRMARHAREDEWLRILRRLEGVLPAGSPAWVTHGMLRQELEASVRGRIAHFHLWDVNQMTGWHLGVAYMASSLPLGTPAERASFLRRFRALPAMVGSRINDLRYGASEGYTAARQTVHRVVQQIEALLASPTLESAAARAGDDRFAAEWRGLLAGELRPALASYRDFLANTYMAVAREDGALVTLPHGLDVYRAEVFRFTSLDLAPDDVMRGAEDEIAEIERQLRPILARLYPGASLAEAKRAMREDRRHTHPSRDHMIEHARAVLDKVKPQLPRFFRIVPDVPLVVEPMTPVEERIGASAYYQSPEGGQPGRFVLNTAHAEQCGRWETTCSAVHEAYPGHHFERIYGDKRSSRHPATRELQTQAFREGWAFYSEWLANDMGVYETDAERAGSLLHPLEVWVGLLADVLLHTGRLTHQQTVDMLITRAGRLPHVAEARADRSIAAPGQVTCYMLGYREVRQFRQDAESALGSRFDAREFHDVLLRDGPITLPMQRAKINTWIEETRHAHL
jgi:uncharacterized protein (DUF885 family)